MSRSIVGVALSAVVLGVCVTPASAQNDEIEPRVIAERGQTLIGLSGSLSRYFSSEELIPGVFTVQVDGHRFLLSKVAIRLGVIGGGSFGGASDDDEDDEDDEPAEDDDSDGDDGTNLEDPALEALVGAVYYLTPQSLWSFYAGAEYRARLTERAAGDPGAVSALLGLQGALSSRASLFLEGGYGIRLRRGEEGELQTRIVGLAGVRVRF